VNGRNANRGTSVVDKVIRFGRRTVVLVIVACIASLALVVAALWLPWATLEGSSRGVTTFASGLLAGWLVALALFTTVLSLLALRWPSTWISSAMLGSSICALGLALLLALRSISLANSVPIHAYSQTSYASGSELGVLAGVALTVTAVLSLNRHRGVPYP
jgi:hypothetical protein